jgi:fatty acid desaturase
MRTPLRDDHVDQTEVPEKIEPRPPETFERSDDYAFSRLLFASLTGLAAIVAAMLPWPESWRNVWLAICLFCFVLFCAGLVLLFRGRPE